MKKKKKTKEEKITKHMEWMRGKLKDGKLGGVFLGKDREEKKEWILM